MKIKIVKVDNRYLYKISDYFYKDSYLMNGKELETTFNNNWFICEEYPNLLQKRENFKINEKWELKNKDLYNETIPLIVDEHSKEKYKNLVESDLYLYNYENKEILKDVELEVEDYTEINDDVPFGYKIALTSEGWNRTKEERYLINNIQFSLKDNCLTPTPIKELTKPCVLKKEYLYEILTDYVKRNIDRNYAFVEKEYRFCFRVCCANEPKSTIVYWENDYDKRYTFSDLYAKNFKDLIKKIETMEKEIITYINQKHICPTCGGTGCTIEKLDINKYFDNE